jgi:HAE1 family hydrophobic/amphiphilic exporter-1
VNLVETFIKNPVKVAVAVLLVALFGFVAMTRMPMQLTPEVQRPTITIETRWPGASPQEVEREIVIEQEEQLKGVEGIWKLTSESVDSLARITLEFNIGMDMEKSVVDVISRLEQVPEYPEDSDKPVINTANANDRPIAWFILSARRPTKARIRAFQQKHQEHADELRQVLDAHNAGLAMLRLRLLAKDHPEIKELLPPDTLDVTKLRRFAEDEIEARFERVPGVSQSNVIGGLEDELQVVVDPQKLAARGLTIIDVRDVLRRQNQDTSAGDYWEGKRRQVTRTLGQFRSTLQVENQLLAVRDGAPVYVRDVAEVRLGFKKPDGLVRRFGESSIAINCQRETGANVLEVMEGLRQVNRELNDGVLKDRGLQLTQVYDETDYIHSAIDLVEQNIFIGGALTMIVLMAFLHSGVRSLIFIPLIAITALSAAFVSPWFFVVCLALIIGAGFWFSRGALVVGLAIPTSIVGTFLILSMLGRSLNVVSLAGMAFAVGMLVDNAVVVLENIHRRYSLGGTPQQAAIKGTQEVWGAVVLSTLTTVAVFLPIVFVQEEAGQIFRDIALAISVAVSLSLIVSVTVIPTASARFFSRHRHSSEQGPHVWNSDTESSDGNDRPVNEPAGLRQGSASHELRGISVWKESVARILVGPQRVFGQIFVSCVVGINAWIQQRFVRRAVVVVLMVALSAGLSYAFWPKVEYLPTGNRNLVFGILSPPPGYNLDQLMELGETVEARLRPYWDVDPDSPEAENLDFPPIGDFFFVARGRRVFMGVRAHDPTRVAELVPLVQRAAGDLPGTFGVAKQSSLFEQGISSGRTIEIEIVGPDLERLVAIGGQVLGQVRQVMPNAQARPVPSLDLSSPETHIKPRLLQAAEMEMSNTDLGFTVNALVDGAYAGDYFHKGDKIDLTIIGNDRFASSLQDVKALPVATSIEKVVPLEALAEVVLSSGPEQINRRERVRAITIEVSPQADVALEDAMQTIQAKIVDPLVTGGKLSGGYRINLAGTADKLAAMQTTFLGRWDSANAESLISVLTSQFVLVVLITYLMMAALFESWVYPLVIILGVPLGAVGGILGLNMLNVYLGLMGQLPQQLDVLTMLGFVILVGTVVNNPILIVHQSLNHIREEGMTPQEAVLASVRSRIRPIFMTTLTTLLGLLPLVLFPGAGSELYRGLGSVVLGGLAVSTIFTLLLIPTLFTLALDGRQAFGRLFLWARVSEPKHEATVMPKTQPSSERR